MSDDDITHESYDQPAGGWGSVKSLLRHSTRQGAVSRGPDLMRYHNKPGGYMCTSCAWAKPAKPHAAEFCENGAKATFWDLTSRRCTPEFFAEHTLEELRGWQDFDLENAGRLTEPMRYDPATDRYLRVSWEAAFEEIGARLRALDPRSVVYYASGRASLETSYMYQLLARLHGTNSLPDSSNMCHETTSVALPQSIGVPVGTVLLDDFDETDCILAFGQNVGSNSPRMLHQLQSVRERDVPIVVFNPLRERGWEEFVNPQSPRQMVLNRPTQIATQYLQPRNGGDLGCMMGMAKSMLAREAAGEAVLDHEFIAEHTDGFDDFAATVERTTWDEIERDSGLGRKDLEAVTDTYIRARSAIAIYGMGLTQHRRGVETVRMLVNLLLMRGNIGRLGAGLCPVRGHSNVQGQRTVGIAEKTELVPLDRLGELYGFEPPQEDGFNTVEACEAVIDGRVRGFVALGGNFLRAVPETGLMEAAWTGLDLSVQVATKLNRSHLFPGEATFLLPCLVRSEVDMQASGPQAVTMEDSTACIHASRGVATPASEHLLSEPAIVAGIATAALPPNPKVPWKEWVGNYALVRDAIEATFPDDFRDFNARLDTPGGFPRPIGARERRWDTDTGRANFVLPRPFDEEDEAGVLRLMTLRSNDQFNTTIYGMHDRFRGLHGSRMVVMLNAADMERQGIRERAEVALETVADDGISRRVEGLQALAYDVPEGSCWAYYPECNPLIPLWHHAEESKTPAAKSVPVRVVAADSDPRARPN